MSQCVLIVDDEESVRHVLQSALASQGYAVLEARSGEHALEVAGADIVDLVITDLKMPGMDGLTLAGKLLEQDPDRPVVLMTAYSELESARRAVSVGVYEYYTKPFNLKDVLAGVRRALERRKLVLQAREHQRELERKVEDRTRELRVRVRELEARDHLLQAVLFGQDSRATLAVAVKLALDLANCDCGVLYLPDGEGGFSVGAAVGTGATDEYEDLAQEIAEELREVSGMRTTKLVHSPGPVRKALGIHSFGVAPLARGEHVIGVLELGKTRPDNLFGALELDEVGGFLDYVAIASADHIMQEESRGWTSVEDVLKAAQGWQSEGLDRASDG